MMPMLNFLRSRLFGVLCLLAISLSQPGNAEQFAQVGPYQVHYIAFPTTVLNADVARRYDIVRGRNRGLLNISVLDAEGKAVAATVTGQLKNLPGQVLPLRFTEVSEEYARYYLADFRFSDDELLRFTINITAPAGDYSFKFQQKLNWEE